MRRTLRVNVLGALALTMLWATAPDAPLADAAMRGDVDAVRTLLEEGADVNASQGDGMTALHWAAHHGNVEITELLTYAGALVEPRTRLGKYTPLHLASREGHAGVVNALLAGGADPDAVTSTGSVTALHLAADAGSVETIEALAGHGAELDAAERVWGHTPLMFAAAADRPYAITALLGLGAAPDLRGSTIDMLERDEADAASQQRRQQLLEIQTNPSLTDFPEASTSDFRPGDTPTEIGRYGGHTALTLAARDGNIRAARALLDGGADIDQGTDGNHASPLLVAAINGQFDLASMLLERGADVSAASDAGNTPVFATLTAQWIPKARHPEPADYMHQQTTYLELMQALIDAGADVNARLKYNVWHMELGADYLSLDWTGANPFFRAVHALDLEAMKMLVEHGADPNVPSLKGKRTFGRGGTGEDLSGLPPVEEGDPAVHPIHLASGYGYGFQFVSNVHRHVEDAWLPVLKYLVEEHGADVTLLDSNGDTPIHNAAARGDNDMIRYLVEKGADATVINRRGQTTVDMANGPQQRVQPFPETMALLESLGAKNNDMCISC